MTLSADFLFVFQYHNKVTCFMLQQIEECCSLGAHAAVIVPPTWIIRVRRPQVQTHTNTRARTHTHTLMSLSCLQSSLKSSKKKKRTSLKSNKASKKGGEVRK